MTKIGSIYVEVRGDYEQFTEDLRVVRAEAKKSGKEISEALGNSISAGQASRGVEGLTRNLLNLSSAAKVPGENFKASAAAISSGLTDMAAKAGLTEREFADLNERMLRTQAAKNAENSLRNIARAADLSETEMRQLGRQMGMTDAQLDKMTASANRTATGFSSLGSAIRLAVAYLSVRELGQMAGSLFEAARANSAMEKSFQAITGSAAGAATEFKFLRGVADDLGQNFYVLAESYKLVAASARGTALEGEGIREIFQEVIRVGGILGASSDQIQRVFLQMGQGVARTRFELEDLKTISEALPGVGMQQFAAAMGVTTAEFLKMVSAGQVASDVFLPALAKVLKEQVTGEVDRATAAQNKFAESWMDLKVEVSSSGFLESATDALRELASVFKDESFQDSLKSAAEGFGSILEAMAGIAKYAGMRSIMGTYTQALDLSSKGLLDMEQFRQMGFLERQRLVDSISSGDADAGSLARAARNAYLPATSGRTGGGAPGGAVTAAEIKFDPLKQYGMPRSGLEAGPIDLQLPDPSELDSIDKWYEQFTEKRQQQIQTLREMSMSDAELEMERFNQRMEFLEMADDYEFESATERYEMMEALTEEHWERMSSIAARGEDEISRIKKMSWEGQTATVLGAMADMTAGVAQHSKAMFMVNKIAAIAEATISLHEAASKAYKWGVGIGGPPLGAAMAGIAVAAQMARIAAIASTQFGGGGKGAAPSVSGTTPATPVSPVAATPTPRQNVTIALASDRSRYTREEIEDILDGLNELLRDGANIASMRVA